MNSAIKKISALFKPSEALLSPREAEELSGRIHFIDGLRAIAAVYVVFHHAMQFAWPNVPVTGEPWIAIVALLQYGRLAVAIFIALSGYVLMLPILRNRGKFKRGIYDFYKRRARRILPAYYLAMAISLVLIFGPLSERQGTAWDLCSQVNARAIVDHLLLIQNWTHSCYAIDSPMWSLAIEWQIYLVFPIIIFAWFRFGAFPVMSAFLLLALRVYEPFDMFTLYLAFTIGMLTAQLSPWILRQKNRHFQSALESINKFLTRPALLKVGAYSYSLYLTHIWTMAALYRIMMSFTYQPSGPVVFCILVGVGVPIALLVGYLFSLIGERPMLRGTERAALTT